MARLELYRETVAVGQEPTHLGDGFTNDVYGPGKWRWRYISNGHEMGGSKHGYARRIDCLNGAATVLGCIISDYDGALLRVLPSGMQAIPVRDLTKAAL